MTITVSLQHKEGNYLKYLKDVFSLVKFKLKVILVCNKPNKTDLVGWANIACHTFVICETTKLCDQLLDSK